MKEGILNKGDKQQVKGKHYEECGVFGEIQKFSSPGPQGLWERGHIEGGLCALQKDPAFILRVAGTPEKF